MKIHPIAWLIWLITVLATVSITRNPIYLLLVLLWLIVIKHTLTIHSEAPPTFISPWKFASIVLVTTTLFNALFVHVGQTVLFKLPLFGSPITLEAAFYGLLNGLTLTIMFIAFTVINHALPARALVRLIPRAFYPVAVVVAIALTFVPATLRHLKQIREAQAVRGHQWRGIRDWLPLLIPLLIGGLERALQLAEAMTARGFANQPSYDAKIQTAIIFGLVLLLSGWLLRQVWSFPILGLMILLTGIAVIGITIRIVGQRIPYTRYRPQPWQRLDSLVTVSAVVVFAFFLLERSSIVYYPYPVITMPSLNPILALVTVGLAMPGARSMPDPSLRRDAA
jgi:energy-coupling factor transport system permease protein